MESTWCSCCWAWAGLVVAAGEASASRSQRSLVPASSKSGGRIARSATISGWLRPVPASSVANAFCAAAASPVCAALTMVSASSTACRYVGVGAGSAVTVTGQANPRASSSGASALMATRAFSWISRRLCRRHMLRELKQIEGFAPHAEVEIDEHDADLYDGIHQPANHHTATLRNTNHQIAQYTD